MILKLRSLHLDAIRAHGERTYPYECCGLLLGQIADGDKTVVELWQTENAWSETAAAKFSERSHLTKERRYVIEPREMLRVQKQGRDRHLSIIGIYHSHPDCAAIPSECDRTFAWPQYSYIIISVNQGKATDIQNWVLDRTHHFQSEEIIQI